MTNTGFTDEQKAGIHMRDGGRCVLCGAKSTEANHRLNRGIGGRPSLNTTANGCALCTTCNRGIEADPLYAEFARYRGVKLREGDDPEGTPYWSPFFRLWIQPVAEHAELLVLEPAIDFEEWRAAA